MSEATKQRKRPTRREGTRFRVALVKGEARLSFSISPSDTGYTLRARHRTSTEPRPTLAVEHFTEAMHGDSFAAAKKRTLELVTAASQKGWSERKAHRAIEDLL